MSEFGRTLWKDGIAVIESFETIQKKLNSIDPTRDGYPMWQLANKLSLDIQAVKHHFIESYLNSSREI